MTGSLRRWLFPALTLLAPLVLVGVPAGAQTADGGSFRAAQDKGMDMSLRPVDLINLPEGRAAPGSYRAAQDISRHHPLNRDLGEEYQSSAERDAALLDDGRVAPVWSDLDRNF